MTVAALIEELKNLQKDLNVYILDDDGGESEEITLAPIWRDGKKIGYLVCESEYA